MSVAAKPTSRERGRAPWALVLSVLAHLTALGGVGALALHLSSGRAPREIEGRTDPPSAVLAVELPSVAEGVLLADREVVPEGTPPAAHGGSTLARVDNGVLGRGGDAHGERATNLAAYDDGMRFDPDVKSHLDKDQIQRLRTAKVRTTREDRRATTHPMELTFLATGAGARPERRPVAPSDPSRGSLAAPAAAVLGGRPGSRFDDTTDASGASPGSRDRGQLVASPGVGVRDRRAGVDHRASSTVAFARPMVTEGAVTIPATLRGRPNDTVDSDQEVASALASIVHASAAGGPAGAGRGGAEGPSSDPGAGGTHGRGSSARPLGAGDGDVFDWFTNDPDFAPYFRKIHAKVHPLWKDAFPMSARAELKQGTVIFEVTVAPDGSATVKWPPLRPSGIDEFDRNCAEAIRRASPFPPIPQVLRDRGWNGKIRAPFVAKNPIIQ